MDPISPPAGLADAPAREATGAAPAVTTERVRLGPMAHGGDAVARSASGRVVFVAGGIPGEDVTISWSPPATGVARADVEEILAASPDRVVPPCRYFGACGGCQWQHIDYPAQVAFKQRLFEETVRHQLGVHDLPFEEPIPSPDPWWYRATAQFSVARDGRLGYLRIRSHEPLPVESCLVVNKLIQEALSTLQGIVPDAVRSLVGGSALRQVAVRMATDERGPSLLLVCYGAAPARPIAERIAWSFASRRPETRGCWFVETQGTRHQVVSRELLWGRATLRQRIGGLTFRIGPTAFFQVNAQLTETLVDLVRAHVAAARPRKLLDLHCGVGLFALSTANLAEHTAGADSNEAAVDLARESALENGLEGVRFLAAPADEALALHTGPDMVVVDPPRAGCDRQLLAQLLERRPAHVVYVSCDSTTLARDLKDLVQGGYEVRSLRLVDLFPQTHHVESVTSLRAV